MDIGPNTAKAAEAVAVCVALIVVFLIPFIPAIILAMWDAGRDGAGRPHRPTKGDSDGETSNP